MLLINIMNIYTDYVLDTLKDIFISKLFEKSLIEYYQTHNLNVYFRVKRGYSSIIEQCSSVDGVVFANRKTMKGIFKVLKKIGL